MERKGLTNKLIYLAAICLLLFFIGCPAKEKQTQSKTEITPGNPKPNVIFILVDTLRTDFVGAYGGKYPTPVMDMLAQQGTTFTKAYAPSSWTVPSIASLFTGLYPQTHGLVDGVAVYVQVFKQQKIPESYPLISEQFKKAGYTTFCITMNGHMDELYGYNRGFDHFTMEKFQGADALEQRVAAWKDLLDQASKTTGYFLYLHWIDPHHPYVPQEPYINQIRPDYMKQVGRTLDDIGPERLREMGYFKDYPESLNVLKDVYASEVVYTDTSVGKVLKMLPDVGKSLLVFTSDHGEAFNEHNSMLHGYDLYQETVHVPLVLIYPDKQGAGKQIDTPVSLVDLPPTILSFAGAQIPETYQGKDLRPLIAGQPFANRQIWSHLDKNGMYRWEAVYDQGLKFLYDEHAKVKVEKAEKEGKKLPPAPYLYDLQKDPGEKSNLAKKRAADTKRLGKSLTEEMSKPPLAKPETVEQEATQELMDKFRQTGYL